MLPIPFEQYREYASRTVLGTTLAFYNGFFTAAEIDGITSDVIRLMRKRGKSYGPSSGSVIHWTYDLTRAVVRDRALGILASDPARVAPPGHMPIGLMGERNLETER